MVGVVMNKTKNWIIGRNSVKEALRAGRKIRKLYITKGRQSKGIQEIITQAEQGHIPLEFIATKDMDALFPTTRHQGIAAESEPIVMVGIDSVLAMVEAKGETPFLILLDGIEDVHNMGAIIRTAECAGAHSVLIPKHRSAPINETVGKTSAGAIEYMPLVSIGNVTQTVQRLQKKGFWVIGADMSGSIEYDQADMTVPLVLVIGSEGKGISPLVKKHCDLLVRIPMFGQVNSLNASVASAILIYEAVRQRK